MTELADKQLKALEDFLGGKDGSIIPDHFYEDVVYRGMFVDWLLSPEGQAALMDKIEKVNKIHEVLNEYDSVWRAGKKVGGRCVSISILGEAIGCSWAETRQEAIIRAVLDMLGAKTT